MTGRKIDPAAGRFTALRMEPRPRGGCGYMCAIVVIPEFRALDLGGALHESGRNRRSPNNFAGNGSIQPLQHQVGSSTQPRWRSIISPLSTTEPGLTSVLPAYLGAVPWWPPKMAGL